MRPGFPFFVMAKALPFIFQPLLDAFITGRGKLPFFGSFPH